MGSNDKMHDIMNRIKSRRLELDMSYQDFADRTGLSKSTLQRYETGFIKNMPLDKIEVVAKALETTPMYLLGWDNLPPSDTDESYIEPEYTNMAKMLQEKGLTYDDFIKILRIYDAFNAEDNN